MKRKLPLILLCLVFGGIAVFSGYQIVSILTEYKAGETAYSDLQQYINLPESDPQVGITEPAADSEQATSDQQGTEVTVPLAEQENESWPQVNFDALKAINTDVVGWIYLEDTKVNFPVAQGDDNTEYLYWLINGDYNSAGTPFMDYRNASDFSDRNTIIYGHNMINGAMFADIHKFTDQAYYEAHPVLYLLTPEGNHRVELFAGYITGLDADAWQREFESDEAFEAWLDNAINRSAFISDVVPTAADKVLTLSTCSSSANKTRFVLLGVIR